MHYVDIVGFWKVTMELYRVMEWNSLKHAEVNKPKHDAVFQLNASPFVKGKICKNHWTLLTNRRKVSLWFANIKWFHFMMHWFLQIISKVLQSITGKSNYVYIKKNLKQAIFSITVTFKSHFKSHFVHANKITHILVWVLS